MKLPRTSRRYRLQVGAVGLLGALLIRALGRTWRITSAGADPFVLPEPKIGALWHQGLLIAAYRWRGKGLAVPVSQSRDGDLIDAVLRRLGFAESPRGSSSRGASGLLRSMIRLVRGGTIVAMLPDGPRGPAREAKPGVVALAGAAGAVLFPVGVAARPAHRFASWDRALLPLPFARVHCIYGEPLVVPKRPDDLEVWRKALESALDELTAEAERALGAAPAEAARGDVSP